MADSTWISRQRLFLGAFFPTAFSRRGARQRSIYLKTELMNRLFSFDVNLEPLNLQTSKPLTGLPLKFFNQSFQSQRLSVYHRRLAGQKRNAAPFLFKTTDAGIDSQTEIDGFFSAGLGDIHHFTK